MQSSGMQAALRLQGSGGPERHHILFHATENALTPGVASATRPTASRRRRLVGERRVRGVGVELYPDGVSAVLLSRVFGARTIERVGEDAAAAGWL